MIEVAEVVISQIKKQKELSISYEVFKFIIFNGCGFGIPKLFLNIRRRLQNW